MVFLRILQHIQCTRAICNQLHVHMICTKKVAQGTYHLKFVGNWLTKLREATPFGMHHATCLVSKKYITCVSH